MADLAPLSNYDSRPRIQQLWEFIQRDIVELESETDQPPEQVWFDFMNGDLQTDTKFFKDFLELFYLTKHVINEKNDDDISRLVRQIESWKDAVKQENAESAADRRKVDLGLVDHGIDLFREYEAIMMQNGFIQVINKNKNFSQ